MVRRTVVLLALALGVIPGGMELGADAAHLVLDGHLEAEHDDACGESDCDESGCAPGSHACSCCPSLRVAPSESSPSIARAGEAGTIEWLVRAGRERPSFARGVSRPPNA